MHRDKVVGRGLTKVVPGEDALHGVVGGVTRSGCSTLIAGRAQVIVIAYQALVPPPAEIGLQTCITAHTCGKRSLQSSPTPRHGKFLCCYDHDLQTLIMQDIST